MSNSRNRAARQASAAVPPIASTEGAPAGAPADAGSTDDASTGAAERPPEGGDANSSNGAGETLTGAAGGTSAGETLTGAASLPSTAPEGAGTIDQGKAGGDGDAGEAQGVAQDQVVDAGAALAPQTHAQLQAQARETLIGTIGNWADAGAREILRVAGLVAEHGNWTIVELEEFGGAFNRVALEAMSSAELMKVQRNAERLLDLSAELDEFGIDQDQVLSISADFRVVVTRDGRKIDFGAVAAS